ncbi:MAG TPA: zf-HC2 domain-containing protein [Pyrinomonadaceae bacterium]|nr:zf-HC2 domain-containing protein [Pyrinomonadaceae bacterium]
MTNKCLDEGTLQSYLDGELSPETMRAAATHIALCAHCNNAAREAESALTFFASAFTADNSANVPTEMLRQRIDAALRAQLVTPKELHIESLGNGIRGRLASFATSLTWSPQWAGAMAGIAAVVLLGAILAVVRPRFTEPASNTDGGTVAVNTTPAPVKEPATTTPGQTLDPSVTVADPPTKDYSAATATAASDKSSRRSQPRFVKASSSNVSKRNSLLPGEENYLKTISSLTKAIEASGDAALRPAARGEYERNLAVIDEAISESRRVVRRNPRDRDAAAFLFSAYQNKVELMSAVADQSQLAAAGR